jgi:D-alanine-D-alanine ligase
MSERKLNVLVLAGGESTERDVSLTSAKAVVGALTQGGHRVTIIDALDGRRLQLRADGFVDGDGRAVGITGQLSPMLLPMNGSDLAGRLAEAKASGIEVALSALHGGAGENGRMQALLDMLQIPYTGSPMAASAIAMNKDISKRVMRTLGIPTADWARYDRLPGRTIEDVVGEVSAVRWALPQVVKPADGGSTVGLTLVENEKQLPDAVHAALAVSDSIIIEKYFKGREITIAVLDGAALPPVEIKPSHKLYDYTCKYTKGKSEYVCPAEIDAAIVQQLSHDAVLFYETIGCRGYARIDFIVASVDDYICLELNTLPGMTELSLFPMAARAAGIEFGQLLERLCLLGLERK